MVRMTNLPSSRIICNDFPNDCIIYSVVKKKVKLHMIRIIRRLSLMAACIMAAASCQKDDTLYYNNLTMGNIVDGRFVSDQGNIFNVVEVACGGQLDTMKRAMVLCDILNVTAGGKENEYDVRLNSFSSVLTKDAVALADASGEEISVTDPIHIDQMWYSGGYLNMVIKFPAKAGSKTKHLINLVYEKDADGGYVFNLRHNAFGEVLNEENSSSMDLAGAYVSFPISKIITENKAKISVKWNWYESVGTGWLFTNEKEYVGEYDWERTGYEQVPQTLSARSLGDIL